MEPDFNEIRKAVESINDYSPPLMHTYGISPIMEVSKPTESETEVGQLKLLNKQLGQASETIKSLEKMLKEKDEQAERAKRRAQWFTLGVSFLSLILGFFLNHIAAKFLF